MVHASRRLLLALVSTVCLSGISRAQPRKIFVGQMGGTLYRYSGDTIWVEEDTSVTTTIFRGDTVSTERMVGGRRLSVMKYVLIGDSARLVMLTSATGIERATNMMVPASMVTATRDMLQMQMSIPQITFPDGYANPMDVPLSPAQPIPY